MGEDFTAQHPHPGSVARTRSHPGVAAAMVFAWLLLAAGALVVLAHFLGWLPKPPGLPMVSNEVPHAPAPAVRTQSGVVLLPGETLVEAPPANAPAPSPPSAMRKAAPAPVTPSYAKPAPRKVPPRTAQAAIAPQYSRAEIRQRDDRSICLNCATITSIQPRGGAWEVAIRFDDGSREVIRYYDAPRFRVGDAVHLEDGRLIRD